VAASQRRSSSLWITAPPGFLAFAPPAPVLLVRARLFVAWCAALDARRMNLRSIMLYCSSLRRAYRAWSGRYLYARDIAIAASLLNGSVNAALRAGLAQHNAAVNACGASPSRG